MLRAQAVPPNQILFLETGETMTSEGPQSMDVAGITGFVDSLLTNVGEIRSIRELDVLLIVIVVLQIGVQSVK